MSKITKAICDNCGKELDIEEYYYSANITEQAEAHDKGRMVAHGDFCKECFKERIKKEIK